jgi:plastocyanin
MMKTIGILFALSGLAAQAALAASAPGVTIKDYKFAPETLKIGVGTTVTWTNKDADVHTVMSATGLFVSGALDTDDQYSYTFTKAGTYRIACSLHPQMSETIVVE